MKLGIAGIAVLVGSGLAAALALGAGERAEAARLLHLGGRLMALAAGQPAEDAVARDVPDSRRGRTRLENPGEPKAETAPAQGPATMAALPITDGFETGQAAPDGWQQGAAVPGVQYIWDKNTAFEGKASLCLKKTAQRFFPIADWSRVVRHEGTQRKLRLSAQVKAEQVTKAVIDAQFADAQGNWIKHEWAAYIGAKEAGDPPANHDWKEYAGTVDIPLGAKLVRLGLQIYGPGTVWFDALTASYVTQ